MKYRFAIPFATPNWLLYGSLGVSVAAIYRLGYLTPRSHFAELLAWFALAFLAYFLQNRSKLTLKQGLTLAVFLRLVLLFATPAFSDDYFRFLWDGHLLHNGLNPFLSLPSTWMESGQPLPAGLSSDLYKGLNSSHYYSVYPPVAQAIFWFSTWWAKSTFSSLIIMRLCLLLAEVGTLWLLPKLLDKLKLPARQALWYALNPAIILELTGNLHFEAVMIFFLAAALYVLVSNQWKLAAVLFGLSVGSKLVPLLLLPLLPRFLGWRRAIGFGLLVALMLGLLFSPFLSKDLLLHFGSSLNLYFQKFEFNASVYYLLRALGSWAAGFNLIAFIGPALSFLTLLGALWLGFFYQRERQDWKWLLFCSLALFTLYLLLATIVHPWYISTLVALGTCTRYRYPMVWSGAAVLSYAAYQNAAYKENLWLIALEYAIILGFMVWEIWKSQKTQLAIDTKATTSI
ncbi:hypothetical protein [Rufibacter radiotolerans]|uniref:hypothetical protein n=1 Tax=Rufibacter radiotolerans TaxID=1379910 RepID=UPI0006646CC5|nr:hypothetical protein [Rufibacter radiotolerans]